MRLVDANVLLYASSRLPEEGNKRSRARELLTEPDLAVVTIEVFRAAVSISRRFGLSYWDGAILAAARSLGCDAVYSEDLSSEQDYDGLRVIRHHRGRLPPEPLGARD